MLDLQMTRRCSLNVKKKVLTGNNVSHSNRRTRRTFLPNIQVISFYSDILKKVCKLKVSSSTIRTVEHNEGFDNYLLTTSNTKLACEGQKLKRQLKRAQAKLA